ncbi:hypothetical protein BZL30_4635 [Mycobacterium kansasii]|uniref:Uncharacterized protein n=1 Tax=Mycobacterium kansasii TaxID=1768 RepID=A0A1V3X3C1_MYCKA|nr:hypothetical protein BZL30_4635 [Mycobacterium kansasii]
MPDAPVPVSVPARAGNRCRPRVSNDESPCLAGGFACR